MLPEWSVFELAYEIVEKRLGFIAFITEELAFREETGGHRWQRVSPTERNGRVHTSTVTVSVLPLSEITRPFGEVKIETTRANGPGGQNVNKTATTIVATHVETNIKVRIEGRSQYNNKQTALKVLEAKVKSHLTSIEKSDVNAIRRNQIGSGQRGDKSFTYREKDNIMVCHSTGIKKRLSDWKRGY